jgi:CRP-like cAMP-binding protein
MLGGQEPRPGIDGVDEKIFKIVDGEVTLLRRIETGSLELIKLYEGDYVGRIPFLDMGHEPHSASVATTEELRLIEIDRAHIDDEYQKLSPSLKNVIENTVNYVAATTKVACGLLNKEV